MGHDTTPSTPTVADRLLGEGLLDFVAAAEAAGLPASATPCTRTFLRAAIAGQIDAIKCRGRWLTSAAAVRRWLEARRIAAVAARPARPATIGRAAADRVLARRGLGAL